MFRCFTCFWCFTCLSLLEVLYLLDVLCLLKVIYFRFPIGLTVSHRIPSSTVKNCCFLPLRVKNADLYLTVVNLWLSNVIIPFLCVQKFDVIRVHDITQLRVLIGSLGHFMPKRSQILLLDETIQIPSFLDESITSPDKFLKTGVGGSPHNGLCGQATQKG